MKIAIAGGTGTVGRLITEAARHRGHEAVVVARSTGANVTTGEGLDRALAGADAVIDATNLTTLSQKKSMAFFTAATNNLLAAEQRAGVGHHVALSIVGIDGIDAGYYAGKLAQERLVAGSVVPHTVARVAQFHEFAGQLLAGMKLPIAVMPKLLMRPVAGIDVAEHLIDVAESEPQGRAQDLVGPHDERLVDLSRKQVAHDGRKQAVLEVRLPGAYGRGLASGSLRGDSSARQTSLSFDAWLATQPRR